MKNVVKFLLFIIYATCIFFLPNDNYIMLFAIFNLLIMFINKLQPKRVLVKSMKIIPFIVFTFLVNYILDGFYNALWIGIKLFIVCHITVIYSETTTAIRYGRYNKKNMFST